MPSISFHSTLSTIFFLTFFALSTFATSSSTSGTAPSILPTQEEKNFAYLTILYNDEMAAAVHVLQSSLLSVKSEYKLHCLITNSVSNHVQFQLEMQGINLIQVPEVTISDDRIPQKWRKNLTKLWLWKMIQFQKIVYLDADSLVVQNIDHLFDCQGSICAGINTPIPDKFNTGLMVFQPNEGVFEGMIEEWKHIGYFEDVEQGLLNHYYPLSNFNKDQILSFKYNAFAYCEDKNVLETIDDVFVIHFTTYKPWKWSSYPAGDLGFVWRQYYDALHNSFKEDVHFQLYALSFFPLALLLVFYLGIDHKAVGNRILKRIRLHWSWSLIYLLLCFAAEFLGYFLSCQFLPFITNPFLAWVIVYEWSLFFFLIPVILWTCVHYADELKTLSSSLPISSPSSSSSTATPLVGTEEITMGMKHPLIFQLMKYWRFFIILLILQPFLAIFMNFYYHTANSDVPITLRCVIMFLTVTLPLHFLGVIFACLVPKISRKLAAESRISPREISKL